MAWELAMRNPGITRPMRDLDRLKTVQAVVDRELKPGRAAERLGLSVRQIERWVIRYRAEGPVGLISRHRHRSGNRALKPSVAEVIVGILREHYPDFGPTLATEKLEGATASTSGVRLSDGYRSRQACGFHESCGHRIQQPRMRRACHAWFEDRAPACTPLVLTYTLTLSVWRSRGALLPGPCSLDDLTPSLNSR